MFVPLVDNGKTDTVVGILNNSDVSCTLQGGNFGSPTYKIWVAIEPTSTTLAEWAYVTVSGTSVTQMVRPNPKNHTSGCEVRWVHPADSINNLLLHMEDGWTTVPSHVTATYASATTFTLAGDWTNVLSKTDRIKLTNVTTKYFYVLSLAFGSGVTTVTVTGGSDYTLASGAVSAVYYSKAASPAGFPTGMVWAPAATGFFPAPTVTASRFTMQAGMAHPRLFLDGTSNSASFGITLPAAAKSSGRVGVIPVFNSGSWSATGSLSLTAGSTAATFSTDQSGGGFASTGGKGTDCTFSYEIN